MRRLLALLLQPTSCDDGNTVDGGLCGVDSSGDDHGPAARIAADEIPIPGDARPTRHTLRLRAASQRGHPRALPRRERGLAPLSGWFTRVTLCLLALGALAGCGRAHLFYDTRELRHPPLDPRDERALSAELEKKLAGRNLVWVAADGRERSLTTDREGLGKLGFAERAALWLALSGSENGGENDLRVRVAGKGSVPVSVLLALDGSVRVLSARRGGGLDEPVLSEEGIRERFALKGRLPGSWHEKERRALTESLELLAPEELELVRRIVWDREARSRDGDESRAALYEMKGCRAVIYLYSSALRADRFRFVGDADAPKSAVLHSIVHEIGHAFEQAAARRAYCAAEEARGAKASALVDEGNRLAGRSPVVEGYLRALAGLPAPTDYGNASAHESFAESFALFHVDPAALLRARPAVHAWFAAGGHLRALRDGS